VLDHIGLPRWCEGHERPDSPSVQLPSAAAA
jgi:hypothetical protein